MRHRTPVSQCTQIRADSRTVFVYLVLSCLVWPPVSPVLTSNITTYHEISGGNIVQGKGGEGGLMFSFRQSVVRVVGVLLQIFLVRAEAQKVLQVSSCVRSVRNSSLLVISPSVLTSVLAGAGPHCQHCFTLLDNDLPILQVRYLHSHWSRYVEILSSDWWSFTIVEPRSIIGALMP